MNHRLSRQKSLPRNNQSINQMSHQPFPYHPLNTQHQEIRLLTLIPASNNCDNDIDPIECQLSTHSLLTRPTYNALSYVWGAATSSSDPRNTILLDNHRFPVTANLLSALYHLRPPPTFPAVTLWVDAICINQGDIDERSQQVQLMREIYASAEQVMIWLGEDDEYTGDGVLDKIKEIKKLGGEEGSKEQREQLMRTCADFYFTLAVVRPWFSRVWILQELAMAKDPLVVIGWRSVGWSTLVEVWDAVANEVMVDLGRSAFFHESARLAKVKLDVLNELVLSRRKHGGETLRRLLILSRSSEATNPKDRVYALLGLLAPSEASAPNSIPVPIDYRKPTWEVYSDAVSHIFSRGEGPYYLSGAFLPGPLSHADSLPSWVPDLSRQTAQTATQPSGMQFHPPAGKMGASGVGAKCMNGYRLADKRTLRVQGLFIDVIEEIIPLGKSLGELVRRLPLLEAAATAARERRYQCVDASPQVCEYMDTFKRKEPFWKMLVCSKKYMSGYDGAPDTYEDMYKRLLGNQQRFLDGAVYKAENEYELSLEQGVESRVLFTTKGGFVGTCVADARPADVLSLWFGSPVPFVLRAVAGKTVTVDNGPEWAVYSLIGASYVSGIMGGEMVDELFCGDLVDAVAWFVQ